MASISKTYNSSTTAPEVVNTYGAPTNILKGSIVICVHGLFGDGNTLNALFDNLDSSAYKSYFNGKIIFGTVNAENMEGSSVLASLNRQVAVDRTKNYFIKVTLKNSQFGTITEQVNSLNKVVDKVLTYGLPIVLLGYSKGGVVNMRYSLTYPGKVAKLISIGTPHTDTFIQDIIRIIVKKLKAGLPNILFVDDIVEQAYEKLGDIVNYGVGSLLNGWVTDSGLVDAWNKPGESRPKVTTIRGDAIKIDDTFVSDFIVPDDSASAVLFKNITHRYALSDEMATFSQNAFADKLGCAEDIYEVLKCFASCIVSNTAITVVDGLFNLIANLVDNNWGVGYKECLKLMHCNTPLNKDYLLTHKQTAKYIYFGLYA